MGGSLKFIGSLITSVGHVANEYEGQLISSFLGGETPSHLAQLDRLSDQILRSISQCYPVPLILVFVDGTEAG